MSSSQLKQATKYIVDRAQQRKQTTKKTKDSQARSDAEKEPGQYFVLNKENEAAKLYKVTGIRLTRKERRDLFARLISFLRKKEAALKINPEEKRFLKSQKSKFKKKPGDVVFIVANFEAAKRLKFKSRNPEDLSQIQANYLNSLERVEQKINASDISRASQIGHGDRGIAASQFGLERALGEAVDKFTLSDAEVEQLRSIILRQRENFKLKVEVTHQQFIHHKGRFSKKFTFVLSSQYFAGNAKEALLEKNAFLATIKDMEVVNQETSTKPIDAIMQVLTENIAPKRAKVVGKRKKHIKESSKAQESTRKTNEKVVAYQGFRGVPLKSGAVRARKSGVSITNLLGVINQKLPDTVRKNMKEPSLVNRTGRFASSVEVTDIITTPKGFPSIGYTYDKNPYQTFERGFRQGSQERDPRSLIDRSIREIAAQYAIGRFYTRRV